jgi:ASC-1-like (ASCH) protein
MPKETFQEKPSKILQNIDRLSAEHLPTLRKGLKLARENAKAFAVVGAAMLTIGGIDKVLVEKSKDSVNLPVVAESLAKANTYGQGYRAATDFIKQGKKQVTTSQYYQKVANQESFDSIKPPDNIETIAQKLENNADTQAGFNATERVLRERSNQKINPDQSKIIQQSVTQFERDSNNRNSIDSLLTLAGSTLGIVGLASLGLREKQKTNSSETSTTSTTDKYLNYKGGEIKINEIQSKEEVDNLPTIADLEKIAGETPRFQNRIDRLNKIEGQDPSAQKFMQGLIESIGISYSELKPGEYSEVQLKKIIDDILNSYIRQIKIGTKINALSLSDTLIKSFKTEIPQVVKTAIYDGLKKSVKI